MSIISGQPSGARIWAWRNLALSWMRPFRPKLWSVGWLIATLLICACQPLPVDDDAGLSPSIVTDERSSAVMITEGDGTVLDINSETGIGSAQVDLNGVASNNVIARLHLSGLEEFRLTYDNIIVMASVLSSGETIVRQSMTIGDGEIELIDEANDYWLDIRMFNGVGQPVNTIPNEDGHFDIRLPANLIENETQTFSIRWIDFYR